MASFDRTPGTSNRKTDPMRLSRSTQWPKFQNQPPLDLTHPIRFRFDRWQRMQAGLYLLSSSGLSVVQELVERLAERFDLPASSGSLQRIYRQYLRETELAIYDVLPYFHTGLAVARLSLAGKILCRLFGWPVFESEWKRLIRLHAGEQQPHHTAMILAFTREARIRGYQAIIVPELTGTPVETYPDVLLVSKNERVYVEVERQGDKRHKWLSLYEQQGFAAVSTLTPKSREKIQKEITDLGIPGQATDLETLRQHSVNGEPGPLWLTKW